MTDNSEIGLYFVGLARSFAFGMGTTEETFHASGNIPVDMEILNNFVSDGVMLWAIPFNILAEMPSGPLALLTSRDANMSNTSSSVHKKSSGHSFIPSLLKLSPLDKGGWALLKHSEKY